jgi:hypothetical protein
MLDDNDNTDDIGVFAECQTSPEVHVVSFKLKGLAVVEQMLQASLEFTPREHLRSYAAELKRVGMIELADLVRSYARKTKPKPKRFIDTWHGKRRVRFREPMF